MTPRWFYVLFFTFVIIVLIVAGSCKSSGDKQIIVKTIDQKHPEIHEYKIPDTVKLCGVVIDLTDQHNYEMFDREFTISVWDRPQVLMWLKRTGRFFSYFEDRLEEEGLPDDLKYLAVAESSLHTHIKSKAGALGIWQLMKSTARRYDLKVERGIIDERLCYERSTDAAMAYINDLKEMFDNWPLVMAAYNCGENKLNQAIKDQAETDYFNLNLPRETERYIFRIAAIKVILENPETYGYQVDESRYYKPVKQIDVDVDIRERYYISDLVKLMDIGYKEFVELNPFILSGILPLGKYTLNVPPGYKSKLISSLKKLDDPAYLKKHTSLDRYYVVKPGDALYSISWETGVSVATIKRLNKIRGSVIRPGQKLILRK